MRRRDFAGPCRPPLYSSNLHSSINSASANFLGTSIRNRVSRFRSVSRGRAPEFELERIPPFDECCTFVYLSVHDLRLKNLCEHEQLKADLATLPTHSVVRKHITSGDCYILNHDDYFTLKDEVAGHFGVHPNDVFAVGSSKLGFSIARKKRYRPFTDTSDIDLAVVSSSLFDGIWEEVFNYRNEVGYWSQEEEFKHYLFRGWIRPDKLPPAHSFSTGAEWWNFFRELTSSGRYGVYKISAGLYRTNHFLESYQSICVKECQSALKGSP